MPNQASQTKTPEISLEEIYHIAKLSHLSLDDKKAEQLVKDLERIMKMIDTMKSTSDANIEPLLNPFDGATPLRSDEAVISNNREKFQAIAPDTKDGYYLVPKVIESE